MIKTKFNDNFWISGNGKDFIEWCHNKPAAGSYNTNLFYSFDDKVDALVQKWQGNSDFKLIMKSLHLGRTENLPEDYLQLKEELEKVPDWVDINLLKSGCELSERSGLMGLLVLRNFSLLSGYNFANLTKPLVATGSLEKDAVNRLYNTLNFWINVSRTGNNSQEKRINACLRTRLVHCVSRLTIQQKYPNWEAEKYGIAINHADMIATNIGFTVYYLFGLKKLNFKYSDTEEKGIFQLWKYVTYLLGVPVEVIPESKEEAISFFKFWTKYQNAPDEGSLKLTSSLLDENTALNLLKLDIIKSNMGYIHKSIANFLIDNEIRKNLNIPSVRFKDIIPSVIRLKNEIQSDRQNQIVNGNYEQISVLKDYKNNIA